MSRIRIMLGLLSTAALAATDVAAVSAGPARAAPALGWDVTGGASAMGNGVPIQLWTYGGGTNQHWRPVQHADGSYSFTPRNNSSECLNVTNVSTADGASCSSGRARAAATRTSPSPRRADRSADQTTQS